LIAGADVIEAGTDGEVYRLDATTGEQVWSGEAARRRQKVVEPPPEIAGSYAQGRGAAPVVRPPPASAGVDHFLSSRTSEAGNHSDLTERC
jgi:hypothetical protein